MFRIRKIVDDTAPADRQAIAQVVDIMRKQFPLITAQELDKLPRQLNDPIRYKYRSLLLVAEDASERVKGFALLLFFTDLKICLLELISAAPGRTGGGIGGILFEHVRAEAAQADVVGLFFECLPDDANLCRDPEVLKQNIARMRFYERYGVRPIINTDYDKPSKPEEDNCPFLMFDDLGSGKPLYRAEARKIVAAILERKYSHLCTAQQIRDVARSFRDNPIQLRAPRYVKKPKQAAVVPSKPSIDSIALIINSGHDIHHVRERGYVEAPVRIPVIAKEIAKLSFMETVRAKKYPEKHIRAVHDADYVDYLRRACKSVPAGRSIYPAVFPLRNTTRPPKDLPMRAGYFCMDTFTPLNRNAYSAAQGAVNCALTGAELLLDGRHYAYALVRPPGHHAERGAFGGFCYFNSASIAANFLTRYGKVAVLDVDYHHGNGTQDIFYDRADVLTVSLHGHPRDAYPFFSGFEDERGEGAGEGFNINYPLAEDTTPERYHKVLATALKAIVRFQPRYLVVALGLDTAKGDPTGSWKLKADDFRINGEMIGKLGLTTLVVQEGGYLTRTLGTNARNFLSGLWDGAQTSEAAAIIATTKKKSNIPKAAK